MNHSYDLVVLGTGAAGMSAALTAAAAGASVGLFEKAPTVGGTSATSGGVAWVPAHNRPDVPNPPTVEDALTYLRSLSNGTMDEPLTEVYAEQGASTLDFIEEHSPVRFTVAEHFPDYKPELPGGRPEGGRSFNPSPFNYGELGDWASRITAFPQDWSNVGFDAETRERFWGSDHSTFGPTDDVDIRITGAALIGGMLKGLLDLDVEPQTNCRGTELIMDRDRVTGVVIEGPNGTFEAEARAGVVIATGGFEWDAGLVKAFLRGPMNGPVSPPNNTGDGLRMAMRIGAALGNMGQAWWVPVVQIPGDRFGGQQRSRSVRLERTRPRSIMVNRYGKRFANEAADYNSLGGPLHHFDANRFEYPNLPAWIVVDHTHLETYGFLGISAGDNIPQWLNASASLDALADRTGIDAEGLKATVATWNQYAAAAHDPDFQRGESVYDGCWGDESKPTLALKTIGPLEAAPFYAVRIDIGAMGTKGGPLTDDNAGVLDVDGNRIPGLYAAGNAMAGPTGIAYGGAGGTIGPALVWGHRAAAHAVAMLPSSAA
jgi:succinate dehydrogenase/fumarate reductase flavoprotein subunit